MITEIYTEHFYKNSDYFETLNEMCDWCENNIGFRNLDNQYPTLEVPTPVPTEEYLWTMWTVDTSDQELWDRRTLLWKFYKEEHAMLFALRWK